MNTDALIAALRAELAGYIRRGLAERAKAVEAELARLGFSAGATPSEVVQPESGSTPTTPAKRTRKPVELPKPAEALKTPLARKKPKK
jgi:hypothetical protein